MSRSIKENEDQLANHISQKNPHGLTANDLGIKIPTSLPANGGNADTVGGSSLVQIQSLITAAQNKADQAFQSANDGKNLITTALLAKGITSGNTFSDIAASINNIGIKYAAGGSDATPSFKQSLRLRKSEVYTFDLGLNFNPKYMGLAINNVFSTSYPGTSWEYFEILDTKKYMMIFEANKDYFFTANPNNATATIRIENNTVKVTLTVSDSVTREPYNDFSIYKWYAFGI